MTAGIINSRPWWKKLLGTFTLQDSPLHSCTIGTILGVGRSLETVILVLEGGTIDSSLIVGGCSGPKTYGANGAKGRGARPR